ncbi:MAG: glycosyltransferase family 2 protein [Deltaproteobacteria bacterium]|nr:glycosyltransferase family 2 protein [Deltaproteobacteria bacterium]
MTDDARGPLLTVAIPAYNRPEELGDLLDSILRESFTDYELLVVEDRSPRRDEIAEVVRARAAAHPERSVRLELNEKNRGYDGNIRRCLELARGEHTFFMGDDDLLKPGALTKIASALRAHPRIGVIIRSYEHVDHDTLEQTEVFRYFAEDRLFPAGLDTICTLFRRSVSIAGFTVHTESARRVATDRFDGTLLYQLYLSGRVLAERDGFFIAEVLTSMRKDTRQRHFFGSSDAEKGLFAPGALTPQHSLNFMRGMVRIAKVVEEETGLAVYDGIVKDIGHYSYPFLRLHARGRGRLTFARYVRDLARMGFGTSPLFWVYSAALMAAPPSVLDRGIAGLKAVLPATPRFGRLYAGEPVR